MVKSPVHSILITGTRGVGKTTIARIFAQALNCTGEGKRPCRQCKSCRVKDHPDIIEVDSAVFGDQNAIEPLVQRMSLLPTYERKIVIFDEAHTISRKGMSMLLKTVEEPSSRTVVILVTTEPDKIDKALRSRCMWLQLRNLSVAEIVKRVAEVAVAEKIGLTKQAAYQIAEYAQGSMREALSILDVVKDYPVVNLEQIEMVVGHHVDVSALVRLLLQLDVPASFHEINRLCVLYEPKLIVQSIQADLLKHLVAAVEAQKSAQVFLEWLEVFRRAKIDMVRSYDTQLCLELAVVDVLYKTNVLPPKSIMMNDWPAFVAYLDTRSPTAGRMAGRLKYVRLKGNATVVCKRIKSGPVNVAAIETRMRKYLRQSNLILEVV